MHFQPLSNKQNQLKQSPNLTYTLPSTGSISFIYLYFPCPLSTYQEELIFLEGKFRDTKSYMIVVVLLWQEETKGTFPFLYIITVVTVKYLFSEER